MNTKNHKIINMNQPIGSTINFVVGKEDYDRAFIDAQFHDMIDEMWIDKEKNRYDVGWNSALAELETRLKIKKEKL